MKFETLPNEILNYIINNSNDALFFLDSNGNFTFVNETACNSLGYTKDELIGLSILEVDPSFCLESIDALFSDIKKSKYILVDSTHKRKDASMFPVETHITYVAYESKEYLLGFARDISQRKKHLDIMQNQYSDYKTIIETTHDGFWVFNAKGNMLDVNSAYCTMSGYTKEELLTMNILDLEIIESEDETKHHIKNIIKNGSDTFEITHKKKSGELIRFEISVSYVTNDGGKFIALLRDITQKNAVLVSLQKHQENLNQAQKLASIGHWELDFKNNNLYWSDEVYRIFGLEPQEFQATYDIFLTYVHPQDCDFLTKAFSDSLQNKSSYQLTHRIVTKKREIRYVEERCLHEYDEEGKAVRSIGTVHDITQRVQSEKKLQLASSVYKHSSDAILITNSKNKIISTNSAFEKLTGYSEKEVLGKNPRVLSSGWGNKEFYQAMWQDIKNNGIWKGEILDRKKNGDNYAASESIIAVKDKDGVIINYIGISHDITQTKENEEHIKQLAYYDFLTKLPNRKLFEQEVESFIKSSRYNERKLALLFLDLDNFKWVNDSLGHHYGDRILLHVSNLLKATLTQETALARLGGDEFVIITPYQDLLSVSQLATKIINTLRYPIALDKHEINLSWSIGVSLFPENGTTYGTLLQNADTAMYKAKERGKNTFKYFNPTMNELAKRRLNLDSRLRFAASHNEFTLAYQPKYTYTKDKTEGFEALIRWNDSKLGSVAPDEFISVAEQSGYIYEIGHWVLQRAMQDLKTIQSQMEDESYTMAINISGKQLEDSRFVKDVKKLLEKNKILKHTIEFEITETAVMQNIQKVIPVLEAFKELGIKLSIDDFGTGYSSMAYLKKMPLNTLKIDREFIKDIHEDNEDRAIVEATIALAKALKLNIVAEGVETKEHLEILKEMQCDTIQGFFYSRPIPLEELLLFLKS